MQKNYAGFSNLNALRASHDGRRRYDPRAKQQLIVAGLEPACRFPLAPAEFGGHMRENRFDHVRAVFHAQLVRHGKQQGISRCDCLVLG